MGRLHAFHQKDRGEIICVSTPRRHFFSVDFGPLSDFFGIFRGKFRRQRSSGPFCHHKKEVSRLLWTKVNAAAASPDLPLVAWLCRVFHRRTFTPKNCPTWTKAQHTAAHFQQAISKCPRYRKAWFKAPGYVVPFLQTTTKGLFGLWKTSSPTGHRPPLEGQVGRKARQSHKS